MLQERDGHRRQRLIAIKRRQTGPIGQQPVDNLWEFMGADPAGALA